MTDQIDKNTLDRNVFDDNNHERKSWTCSGTSCCRSFILFFSNCLSSCWLAMVDSGEIISYTLQTNQLFEWEFCVVQQDTFYSHQNYEQVSFCKKPRLYIFGRSDGDGIITTYLQMAENLNLPIKTWHIFFVNTLSHFTRLCIKRLKYSSCSQRKLLFQKPVKNNGSN